MTDKVKPFYIRITKDMTPQMVQDAFDKCVDAGAVAHDGMNIGKDKCKYKHLYNSPFDFFGVDAIGNTCTTVTSFIFGGVAQEITIDQLDKWLWLEVEQEWKNGDECLYKGEKAVVIGAHPSENTIIIDSCISGLEACDAEELSKPETPEQKAERERLEAAYDLYTHVQSVRDQLSCKFEWFSNSEMEETRLRFLAIVDKTNYRKQQ